MMKKLVKRLEDEIYSSEKAGDFMDEFSWSEGKGVLLPRGNAERLLVIVKESFRLFDKISKGEGRYSRDPLTHAGNTIEDLIELANQGLKLFEDAE